MTDNGGPRAFGTVPGVEGSKLSNEGGWCSSCACCLWEYKSSWISVQFPGGGVKFTFGSSTILGPVSEILGDTGISSSAGVLLGTSSGGTEVDWTGIITVSEGSSGWAGVSARIKELPIDQVSTVERSS